MRGVLLIMVLSLLANCAGAAERKPYTRNVAIVIYENAEPLDWSGPFEVYNDAAHFGEANGQPAFNVYIVSKTTAPVNCQGLTVVPSYSIENAPRPDIVLFPGGPASAVYDDPAFFAWAKKASVEAEIAQSVCTGAFVLGKAGLLDGLEVTTFHGAIDNLQKTYPKTQVKRGRRFVDNGHVVTTAGISAGIDGSLHMVARLLGRRVADQVATYMEYAWSPEASLAMGYSYLNPSTDARGRLAQTGDMQYEEKSFPEAEATFRAILAEDPDNREIWNSLGSTLSARKQHLEAAQAFAKCAEGSTDARAARVYFSAAKEYALASRTDDALAMLEKAYGAGFPDRQAVERDPDLAGLHGDPRVKKLMVAK